MSTVIISSPANAASDPTYLGKLYAKVMYLEKQYLKYMSYDKYLGRNSRVQKLFDECNGLWKEIEKLERRNHFFKLSTKG